VPTSDEALNLEAPPVPARTPTITNTSNAAICETKTHTFTESGLQLEYLICRTPHEYNVRTPYGPCLPPKVCLCASEVLFSVRLQTF